jgi:hypothetical protein
MLLSLSLQQTTLGAPKKGTRPVLPTEALSIIFSILSATQVTPD